MVIYYPTGGYLNISTWPFSPYWGGFGRFAVPGATGAGFCFPAYTSPFLLQSPECFAAKAGFMGPRPIA